MGLLVRDAVRGVLALSVPVPAQRFYGHEGRIAGVLADAAEKLFAAGEGTAPVSNRRSRRRGTTPV